MVSLTWEKDVELDSGVICGFWKLLDMQVDLQSALAMVRYAGWLNQDAYNSGKEMLCDKTLQIDFSNFDPQGQIAVGLLQLVQSAQKV